MRVDALVHPQQQVKHGFGPWLVVLFEQKGEFPQVMGVAEAVGTVIGEIGFPEVVDQAARKIRDDVEMVDRRSSPFLVYAVKGQGVGAGAVKPVELPSRADTTFIDMEDGPRAERLFDRRLKRREVRIASSGGVHNGGFTDRGAIQICHHLADAAQGEQLLMLEIDQEAAKPWPVLGRRTKVRRK